jgi:hypothetical protein
MQDGELVILVRALLELRAALVPRLLQPGLAIKTPHQKKLQKKNTKKHLKTN